MSNPSTAWKNEDWRLKTPEDLNVLQNQILENLVPIDHERIVHVEPYYLNRVEIEGSGGKYPFVWGYSRCRIVQ